MSNEIEQINRLNTLLGDIIQQNISNEISEPFSTKCMELLVFFEFDSEALDISLKAMATELGISIETSDKELLNNLTKIIPEVMDILNFSVELVTENLESPQKVISIIEEKSKEMGFTTSVISELCMIYIKSLITSQSIYEVIEGLISNDFPQTIGNA